MYLLCTVFCLMCLNQCQRVTGDLVDLNSKFVVNDLQPFVLSEVRENPVWNFELSDAAEDDAIESSELSGANDPSFTSDFKGPNIRAGFRINKDNLRDALKSADEEQFKQYEQFKKFKRFEQQQTHLQNLFNLNEMNENQYHPPPPPPVTLDENSLVFNHPKKKHSREIKTYTIPKSSFANLIKDNEYYDYEDVKIKLEENAKDNANDRKLREKNKKVNFNDIRFKLEDLKGKVQKKTENKKEQNINGSKGSTNRDYDEEYVQEIQQHKKDADANKEDSNDKNDEKTDLPKMNKDSISILKHKPKLTSKVIYSDNDEIVITEDKNSTTISVPKKSIEYVDQPSKEPRITKLKKLRRLRKRIRNYQNNSTNFITNNNQTRPTYVIGEGLQKNKNNSKITNLDNKLSSTEQIVNDEINKLDKESDKILNGQNTYTQPPPTPAPVVHHTTSPATDDHTYDNKHGNHTSGKPPHKPKPSDSKDSIIRIVKVIKNNPKTQQIESNVTLINYSQQIVKDVSKNVLNDALKDVLNNDSKEVHLQIDRPKSSRNETKKYQNDDYIDDLEDNEANKKSDINHVLY